MDQLASLLIHARETHVPSPIIDPWPGRGPVEGTKARCRIWPISLQFATHCGVILVVFRTWRSDLVRFHTRLHRMLSVCNPRFNGVQPPCITNVQAHARFTGAGCSWWHRFNICPPPSGTGQLYLGSLPSSTSSRLST